MACDHCLSSHSHDPRCPYADHSPRDCASCGLDAWDLVGGSYLCRVCLVRYHELDEKNLVPEEYSQIIDCYEDLIEELKSSGEETIHEEVTSDD